MGRQYQSWAVPLLGVLIAAGICGVYAAQKAHRSRPSVPSSSDKPKASPGLTADSSEEVVSASSDSTAGGISNKLPTVGKAPPMGTAIPSLPPTALQGSLEPGPEITADPPEVGGIHAPILDSAMTDRGRPGLKLEPAGLGDGVLGPAVPGTNWRDFSKPGLKIEMDPLGGTRFYPSPPGSNVPDLSQPKGRNTPSP